MAVKSDSIPENLVADVSHHDGTYVMEISILQWHTPPLQIRFKGQEFWFTHRDYDNNRDVAGWHYKSNTTKDHFLLIND